MSALRLSEIDKMGHAERLPTIFGNYTGKHKRGFKRRNYKAIEDEKTAVYCRT